jgi:hypothetical protein
MGTNISFSIHKSFNDLSLPELLYKESLRSTAVFKGSEDITILNRIAELYRASNNLDKESEYLNKVVALENNLKK